VLPDRPGRPSIHNHPDPASSPAVPSRCKPGIATPSRPTNRGRERLEEGTSTGGGARGRDGRTGVAIITKSGVRKSGRIVDNRRSEISRIAIGWRASAAHSSTARADSGAKWWNPLNSVRSPGKFGGTWLHSWNEALLSERMPASFTLTDEYPNLSAFHRHSTRHPAGISCIATELHPSSVSSSGGTATRFTCLGKKGHSAERLFRSQASNRTLALRRRSHIRRQNRPVEMCQRSDS
jgi:hypothetical protein